MSKTLTPRMNRLENNILINGMMELAQRNTTFTIASGSSAYTLDRMFAANVSSSVSLTAAQDSTVPNSQLPFSLKLSKTAAGTLAAGTSTGIAYGIEGYDLLSLMADTWSAVFWVRSSVASNRSLSLANESFTHSYVKQYEIEQVDTWELKVVTFPGMSNCPGTLNRTNGLGARLFWGAVHGSTYQTGSLNQWVAGDFRSGTGEDTTWLSGTTHDLYVAGVMVIPGDWTGLTEAGFRMVRAGKSFQDELHKAQRYFYSPLDITDTSNRHIGSGRNISTTVAVISVPFSAQMRAVPSLSTSGTISEFKLQNSTGSSDTNVTGIVAGNITRNNGCIDVTASGASLNAGGGQCLRIAGSTAFIGYDAELTLI